MIWGIVCDFYKYRTQGITYHLQVQAILINTTKLVDQKGPENTSITWLNNYSMFTDNSINSTENGNTVHCTQSPS